MKKREWEDLTYVMVDGMMLLTREEKWKEMKLGRIFTANDRVEINKDRKWITQSKYMAHLGGHEPFEKKMEVLIDSIPRKVFISDGAKWIGNWVDSSYPESLQILDYYHAKEHLCQFANLYFESKVDRSDWVDKQEDLLFNDDVEMVISNIGSLPKTRKKTVHKAVKD